jgi:hypothetical protein
MHDYEDLLMRYIGHVGEVEGVDFIPHYVEDQGGVFRFTSDEVDILKNLSRDADEYYDHHKGQSWD